MDRLVNALIPPHDFGSGNADELRATKLKHAVKRMNGEGDLIGTTLIRSRAKRIPDHALKRLMEVSTKARGSVANHLFQSFSYCSRGSVAEGSVFKSRHFDRSVILLCVRWYLAYNLSLRNLEEMMAERGISVDHATVHRWVICYAPELLKRFNQQKRAVTAKWHLDGVSRTHF
jgi:hypothetical protein